MRSENGAGERLEMTLDVSDQSQLPSLRDWLRGQPDVEVALAPGTPGRGEQGALDIVTILASSTGLFAAIQVLPDFIRSRRSGFRIRTVVRGEEFIIEATNAQDVLPAIVARLLDE